MRHLFGMNATHEHGKWKLLSNEKNYFCNMKEIIETMPRIELALIIIGVFVLILCIIFGYAMIHEYRMYHLVAEPRQFGCCGYLIRFVC